MIRLLALYISIILSVFSPMLVSAIPQNSESDPGTVQAILSILRAHGQASQVTYCYACRWAGQLGNQELPSDVVRDFDQLDPEFIDFYRYVLAQLSPTLEEYGGTIPESQRGPECTNSLQPFVNDIIMLVTEQVRTGEIDVAGRSVTAEDVTVALEQFRAELGNEDSPLYDCNEKVETNVYDSAHIIKPQLDQMGVV